MGAPVNLRELPDDLKARYGVGRTRWGLIVTIAIVVVVFALVFVYTTFMLGKGTVQSRLLTWHVVSPDHVDVTFEVRTTGQDSVNCVVRAQDSQRADVGYATVPIAFTDGYAQLTYPLRTLAPAYAVEVLTCDSGTLQTPGPQFPPGVAPPAQPWTS